MQTSCSIAREKGLGQPGNENLDSVSCLTGARKEDRSEGKLSLHDDSEPWKSTLSVCLKPGIIHTSIPVFISLTHTCTLKSYAAIKMNKVDLFIIYCIIR